MAHSISRSAPLTFFGRTTLIPSLPEDGRSVDRSTVAAQKSLVTNRYSTHRILDGPEELRSPSARNVPNPVAVLTAHSRVGG